MLEAGETVLWQGAPRPGRFLAVQDIFLIPLTLVTATGIMVFSLMIPGTPWPFRLIAVCAAAYVTVGRFVRRWFVKSRTTYLVTNRRAFVCRDGQVYERQGLAGVKPEMSGGDHNRIVTFGDPLESFMVSLGSFSKPEGNHGMQPGLFTARRGDGSKYDPLLRPSPG